MFESFQHYLSYGSTDQQTVRDLSEYFDGLLVPGTIAAFQAEGTKGFVLSLSARSAEPYVIDSRFPLFQNVLQRPKKSHQMLADLLGVPSLVSQFIAPDPASFTDSMIEQISSNWIDFNVGFETVQTKTFDKYAARLGEPVLPENRQDPLFILPPYTMVGNSADNWEGVSQRLWEASQSYAKLRGVDDKLRRVIAAGSASEWDRLASLTVERQIIAWISNLDEFKLSSEAELVQYGESLKSSTNRGQQVFALYGGFFSVLLSRYGLTGSSHGIGFGEHRDWVELPTSGAPPARYYVPRLHRYVGVDIATTIWRQFPDLVSCDCSECNNGSPSNLDYHSLMRHSVRARNKEISEWLEMPSAEVSNLLERDYIAFRSAAQSLSAPTAVARKVEESCGHLSMWSRVIKVLG
ncbi:hypothetical protein [Arthrobacter sp. NtRootA1]|uniref:hypothetical protein n=1 Tax=Arthrobacter sp. NtRootA1 TaxID=2830983 RepID=UPI001CC47A06|nr:hypothetical protein [Arthrobacter sp. NtRootA1]BCW08034.1 hypothetical protein NtRootA1_41720 [Arthrobacter sp. NtRootA1]